MLPRCSPRAVRAKVAYLRHHDTTRSITPNKGQTKGKARDVQFAVFLRCSCGVRPRFCGALPAQAVAEEARRKMLALQNMGTALRENIAQLVES